ALNETAHITTNLKVDNGAKLAWLPQETILFDRARVHRRTEIEIAPESEILALEWLVLGRTAHGEKVSSGVLIDSWRVTKKGRLLWADTLRLTDDAFSHLSRKALLSDSTALATMLYFGPEIEQRLQFFRTRSISPDCQFGGTLVGGMLISRLIAR